MGTFVYSPQIRVHVACDGTNIADFKGNTYDISDDLVQGSIIIRTNGVHTFSFQLQNTMRKYDGVLQPMDRITVEMKRVTWVRVFSGYLNNGPVFSVWPRVLNMSASCTLKRLQYWFWDPTTTESSNLLQAAMKTDTKAPGAAATSQTSPLNPSTKPGGAGLTPASGSGTPVSLHGPPEQRRSLIVGAPATTPKPGDPNFVGPVAATATSPTTAAPQTGNQQPGAQGQATPQVFDDGVKGAVLKILNDVVGWPQEKVHIGEIPSNWVKLASDVGNAILKDSTVDRALIGDLSQGDPNVTGSGAGGGGYGGTGGPAPPGQINNWIQQALGILKWPTSYSAGIYHQIMTESSGDPNAQQKVQDVNSGANHAQGIMQVIPTTFKANALPGHTNILNPVDNIIAGCRYAMGKYGAGWFNDGSWHDHGY